MFQFYSTLKNKFIYVIVVLIRKIHLHNGGQNNGWSKPLWGTDPNVQLSFIFKSYGQWTRSLFGEKIYPSWYLPPPPNITQHPSIEAHIRMKCKLYLKILLCQVIMYVQVAQAWFMMAIKQSAGPNVRCQLVVACYGMRKVLLCVTIWCHFNMLSN